MTIIPEALVRWYRNSCMVGTQEEARALLEGLTKKDLEIVQTQYKNALEVVEKRKNQGPLSQFGGTTMD